MAIRAEKPLVPLAFHGGHRLMPWKSYDLQPGTFRVRFGAPLSTEGLTENDARDLADKAQKAVVELYKQLGNEP